MSFLREGHTQGSRFLTCFSFSANSSQSSLSSSILSQFFTPLHSGDQLVDTGEGKGVIQKRQVQVAQLPLHNGRKCGQGGVHHMAVHLELTEGQGVPPQVFIRVENRRKEA